jgi:hypothetical protein
MSCTDKFNDTRKLREGEREKKSEREKERERKRKREREREREKMDRMESRVIYMWQC